MNPLISVTELSKKFGSRQVLADIHLSLAAGEIVGLVGLNGSGKTTLIRCLLGLMRPTSGSIEILSCNPWKHEARLSQNTGVILEHDGSSGNLSFLDNLRFFARAKGLSELQLLSYLDEWWADFDIVTSKQKTRFFSRGQKVQFAICRAFLGWPQVCLFDEPAVALDMRAYDQFCRLTRHAQSRGAAILISSHQIEALQDLCTRIELLRDGKIEGYVSPTNGAIGNWVIRTQVTPACREILLHHAQSVIADGEDGWFLTLENPDYAVPGLVVALVQAGFPVREVHPVDTNMRASLRKIMTTPALESSL